MGGACGGDCGRECGRSRRRRGRGWERRWGRRAPGAGRRRAGGRLGAWRHARRCATGERVARGLAPAQDALEPKSAKIGESEYEDDHADGEANSAIAVCEVDGAVECGVVDEDEEYGAEGGCEEREESRRDADEQTAEPVEVAERDAEHIPCAEGPWGWGRVCRGRLGRTGRIAVYGRRCNGHGREYSGRIGAGYAGGAGGDGAPVAERHPLCRVWRKQAERPRTCAHGAGGADGRGGRAGAQDLFFCAARAG